MDTFSEVRPVWLEINMDNLISNYKEIRRIVNPKTMIMAVIKANAYGHGSIELAKMYEQIGANRLAVSIITEAVELRKAGIKIPIHLLNYTPDENLDLVVDNDNIIQGIYRFEDAKLLSQAAIKKGKKVKIHIKIDTGMGRIGFLPNEESINEIIKINELPNIEIEGIFTHFARADQVDRPFTKLQYDKFNWIVKELEDKGLQFKLKHVSNSASVLAFPEYNMDMVRPGIILFGYYPSEDLNKENTKLKPAMTLKAKISNVKVVPKDTGISYNHIYFTEKETVIATIPIGYADGYSRMLSGKGFVCIKNKRVPIVGRICMDQMMIDVTGIDDVKIGDEVVLFGHDNDNYPHVEELASLLGTVNYEIICVTGRRLPRVYIKKNEIISIKDYLVD